MYMYTFSFKRIRSQNKYFLLFSAPNDAPVFCFLVQFYIISERKPEQ